MDLTQFLATLQFAQTDRPSLKEIKDRWKQLCRKAHPDAGGSEEEFKKITHAYQMLTNADYRQKEFNQEMRRGKNSNRKGDLDIRLTVSISFEDAFFGREVVISYNSLEFDDNFNPQFSEKPDVIIEKIQVPEGSVEGFEKTVPNRGHKLKESIGNATFVFMPTPHPRFRISGSDVLSPERIPLETMLRGGTVDVLTMYGSRYVKILPGTRPGDKYPIRQCGVAKIGAHVAVVEPLYPTKDDLKKGTAWKGLDIDWSEDVEKDKEENDFMNLFSKFTFTV